jgi:hypothetical protein
MLLQRLLVKIEPNPKAWWLVLFLCYNAGNGHWTLLGYVPTFLTFIVILTLVIIAWCSH